jgi:hypothetical protein
VRNNQIRLRRSIHHALDSSGSIADRRWRSSLVGEFVHTDGEFDQDDFECRGGNSGRRVAPEWLWAFAVPTELQDRARLITKQEVRK